MNPGTHEHRNGYAAATCRGLLTFRVRRGQRPLRYLTALALLPAAASAAVTINSYSVSPASPQPVGTQVLFAASASTGNPADLRYRFRVRPAGGAYEVFVNYGTSNTFVWSPMDKEGSYDVEVTVRDKTTGEMQTAAMTYTATSRASGATPVVGATAHPLVALYSAPACPVGSSMRVRFKRAVDALWMTTPLKTCTGVTSMNFYIAGMRASSGYELRHDVVAGPRITSGPVLSFTTGALPRAFTAINPALPVAAPTRTNDGFVLWARLTEPAFATDVDGNVIWYDQSPGYSYMTRPVPGGNVIKFFGITRDFANSGFSEVNPVGEIVKSTTVERVNQQLVALGKPEINALHHEMRRLPNGNYLGIGMREVISDAQGPGSYILGDVVLVFDNNLEILWLWDSFQQLDVTRRAVGNETCVNGAVGCVVRMNTAANDWTHSNSVALTPDGNLILSSRHQDFVYKIAYANGAGDGHVIWKLGKDGDFAWISSDPYPWFSHTHDAEYEPATGVLSVFDNGNTRAIQRGGNSRGQVLQINEVNRTVTPLINADMGGYSPALSSAQRLSNGNYFFGSGTSPNGTDALEVDASGRIISQLIISGPTYRVFRLRDLYSAPW